MLPPLPNFVSVAKSCWPRGLASVGSCCNPFEFVLQPLQWTWASDSFALCAFPLPPAQLLASGLTRPDYPLTKRPGAAVPPGLFLPALT